MHSEEIIDLKADPGNPVFEREFGVEGVIGANKSPLGRKVVIKVLKREISSGLESVTIQMRTAP